MPIRVIACCQNIIRHIVLIQVLCPFCHIALFRVCHMYDNFHLIIVCFDTFCARREQTAHTFRTRFSDEPAGRFISDLNHIHDVFRRIDGLQRFREELLQSLLLLFQCIVFPRFGNTLFPRICPQIRAVEINQEFQSRIPAGIREPLCLLYIIVAAAVSMPVRIIRIIPDTYSQMCNPI